MHVVVFCQSLISDWNHGNAHFLRGIGSELSSRGFTVSFLEPADSWSMAGLVNDVGQAAVRKYFEHFGHLSVTQYDAASLDLDQSLDNASLVLVHEWNSSDLIARVGSHRSRRRTYKLFFHDTHHRAVSQPDWRPDLRNYDAALVFGESLRDAYVRRGLANQAWVWHEAADVRHFYPLPRSFREDLVWIGNWGDGERTNELSEFVLEPVRQLRLQAAAYGVRYPEHGIAALREAGLEYRGWLPNYAVPEAFAKSRMTVHVPRRIYTHDLPGIPTIRVFEALACGIPLLTAPWTDSEGLFKAGTDFLAARTGKEMIEQARMVMNDSSAASEIAKNGLAAIAARHTCAHRVDELLEYYRRVVAPHPDKAHSDL